MMTDPGLALFDGGLVRTKNVVSTSDAELHLQGGRDGGVGGRGIWPGVGGNGILSVICVSRGSTNAGCAPRAVALDGERGTFSSRRHQGELA